MPENLFAQQTISCEIVSSLNPRYPEEREPIHKITEIGSVFKLMGWIKVEFENTAIKPTTYYLEWSYKDSTGNEAILDSYKTNDYYRFDVRLDAIVTYHWVTKRIWTDKVGKYYFKVFVKNNNRYELVGQEELTVGKNNED
jgi:hypothetical protein